MASIPQAPANMSFLTTRRRFFEATRSPATALITHAGRFPAIILTDSTAPTQPGTPSGTAVSTSQINWTWTASTDTGGSGLSGYRIYVDGAVTPTTTVATNAYSSTGHSESTTHTLRVEAFDGNGNTSTSSGTGSQTTQASGGSLVPFLTATFGTGSIGASCSEYNYAGKTNTVVYANDVAGPFNESKIGKIVCTSGSNFYGGWLAGSQSVPTPAGGDLWIRAFFYFPTSFCAGYGTTSGDGFGLTKFIRIDWSTTQRMTLLVGDYSGSGCASPSVSPRIALVARELQNNTNADMDNFVITRDAWHAIQLHVKFTTGSSGGIIEVWVDGHHCGRVTNLSSLPTGFTTSDGLLVPGDYWNGSPRANTQFYVANVIVATSLPSTSQFLDSSNRPYIPPTLDARTL